MKEKESNSKTKSNTSAYPKSTNSVLPYSDMNQSESNNYNLFSHSKGYCQKLASFFETPIVKFTYNQVCVRVCLIVLLTIILVFNFKFFSLYFKTFHIFYLLLFTYVMLCDFYPVTSAGHYGNPQTKFGLKISLPEIVLIIWTITIIFEKIKNVNFFNL